MIDEKDKTTPEALDLPDSPHDEARLKPEEATIDLPDVSDIPGQEHVRVMPLGELADTTISSDDEEGVGLFDNEDDKPISMGTKADIPAADLSDLETTDEDVMTEDEVGLRRAGLDTTDETGDPVNESSLADDLTGSDLDVPGSEDDDLAEDTGEEDEENNSYSVADND